MRVPFSLTALMLACFAVIGHSQTNETPKPIPKPDYSKEGVIIEKFSKEIAFAVDGTWQAEQSATIRIQSDAAVQQFGVLSFGYNRDSQKLGIAYVRVRKPDGNVVVTPDEDIQDVSSEITRIAPTYSDLREKQIPVKALGVGDVLEYRVRFIQSKPDIPGQFWDSESFIKDAVVLDESLKISVPADKYVKVASPAVKPELHEMAGSKVYLWKTAQLEPTSRDPDKPKKKTLDSSTAPVQITTFKSWDELGQWYGNVAKSQAAVTPAIRTKAEELTKGLSTDADKERAIYKFVSTGFHYVSISFGVGRYQPHTAEEVLANQYGDCKDKHTLFVALLKAAGIEAWPALIGSGLKFAETVPSPAQFNHVITVIPNGKGYEWLDTTAEVAPYGLLASILRDKNALVIPNEGVPVLVKTPANPPFPASQVVEVRATLNEEGVLTAHFDVTMHGDDEVILRAAFRQVPPAQWRDLVQGIVNSMGFAGTVSAIDVDSPANLDKPFHYSYDYKRQNYSDWENRRISPPLYPLLFEPGDNAEEPTAPFFFGALGDITYRAKVQLPTRFSAQIPENKKIESEFGEYRSSYSLTDHVLTAERHLILKQAYIPVKDWSDYRKFAKSVAGDHNQFVQLESPDAKSSAELADSNNEAKDLIFQALQAGQRRDFNGARDYLARAERLNPKQWGLWAGYGLLYFSTNEPKKAYGALRKEIQLHPDNLMAYQLLAQGQEFHQRHDEAIETLRSLLKVAPENLEAMKQLSALLMLQKRYLEIPDLLQPLLVKTDNAPLQSLLAEALLRAGRKDEGIAAAQKAVKTGDDLALNNLAYALADTNTDLTLAKECAEKAVSKLEERAAKFTLSSISDSDLALVNSLAAAWDTLGWVYFRSGDLTQAEHYVNSSWRLCQRGEVGLHLGEIYDRQGKRQAAIHVWHLALAANDSPEIREQLRKTGASVEPPRPRLQRGGKAPDIMAPGEELGRLRTTSIAGLPKQTANAEFFLLFSGSKLADAQFISGSDSLKEAAHALVMAHYDTTFLDGGPEKIIRRGILSCSTYTSPSCQLTMLLPATTRK